MKNFILGLHAAILGIGGASGIILENDRLVLISDDSYVLYIYSLEEQSLQKINLHPGDSLKENMQKSEKPDFEAIARDGDFYFVFGSGSAENRFDMVEIDSRNLTVTGHYSLESLYGEMLKVAAMDNEDFNIEGVVFEKENALFFNRGNGPGQQNGVFKVFNWRNREARSIEFFPVQLPQISGKSPSFTDATLVDNDIYFLSTAEDTISTYDDGEVLGSAIGRLSLDDFSLLDFQQITDSYKLEGISFFSRSLGRTSFLLCEDPDDDSRETKVFKLDITDP